MSKLNSKLVRNVRGFHYHKSFFVSVITIGGIVSEVIHLDLLSSKKFSSYEILCIEHDAKIAFCRDWV